MENNYLLARAGENFLRKVTIDTNEEGITDKGMGEVRELIDGYVEIIHLGTVSGYNLLALVDEDAIAKGKKPCIKAVSKNGVVDILGDIVFCTSKTYTKDGVTMTELSGFPDSILTEVIKRIATSNTANPEEYAKALESFYKSL